MIVHQEVNGWNAPYSVCDKCGGFQWGAPMHTGHLPCSCSFTDRDDIMEIEVNGQKYYYSQEIEALVKQLRHGL